MNLISGKDYKVWFLGIQDISYESHRERISLTLWQIFAFGTKSIIANSDTSYHVRIRDLDNLEFAIFPSS
jgi:hypothetical protein